MILRIGYGICINGKEIYVLYGNLDGDYCLYTITNGINQKNPIYETDYYHNKLIIKKQDNNSITLLQIPNQIKIFLYQYEPNKWWLSTDFYKTMNNLEEIIQYINIEYPFFIKP